MSIGSSNLRAYRVGVRGRVQKVGYRDLVRRVAWKLKGAWIAISEDGVICRGSTAKEVLIEAKERTEKKVTVFKVPRKDEETHVL